MEDIFGTKTTKKSMAEPLGAVCMTLTSFMLFTLIVALKTFGNSSAILTVSFFSPPPKTVIRRAVRVFSLPTPSRAPLEVLARSFEFLVLSFEFLVRSFEFPVLSFECLVPSFEAPCEAELVCKVSLNSSLKNSSSSKQHQEMTYSLSIFKLCNTLCANAAVFLFFADLESNLKSASKACSHTLCFHNSSLTVCPPKPSITTMTCNAALGNVFVALWEGMWEGKA